MSKWIPTQKKRGSIIILKIRREKIMRKHVLHIIALFLFVNVNAQVRPVSVEVRHLGGYIGSLAYEPGNPNHVFAGGGKSGLFESLDTGKHWGHIDSLPAYAIISVSFAPRDSTRILVTARRNTAIRQPSGIWLSPDKGHTWSNRPIRPPIGGSSCVENAGAYSASWIPDSDSVIVGTDCGMAISHNKGSTWDLRLVYSQGEPPPTPPNTVQTALAIDKDNFVVSTARGTYWTDNRGAAWHLATGLPPNVGPSSNSLAITPTRRKILFFYPMFGLLHYSEDNGHSWNSLSTFRTGQNQPPFVKATVGDPPNDNTFTLYVGDGTELWRMQLDTRNTRAWSAATPEHLRVGHKDPQDILFHPETRKPYVLAGDGGIQIPSDPTTATWVNVGGGAAGMNGLEAKGIGVQSIFRGGFTETDIYLATWHNGVVWSPDAGRSWHEPTAMAEASNLELNGPTTTDSEARLSLHDYNKYLGFYGRGYVPVTTSFEPLFQQGVEGVYFRYFNMMGVDSILARKGNDYWLAPQTGGEWKLLYRLSPSASELGLLNAPSISYRPDNTPVLYQPYLSGVGGRETKRLMKITLGGTAANPTAMATPLPLSGVQNLGYMFEYWWKSAFASKPGDPGFLIAADVDTNEMKKSTTGGANWTTDPLLTSLITDYDPVANRNRLHFYVDDIYVGSQAQVICFNPYNNDEIYIGTIEAGIIYSRDSGESWNRIEGSRKINYVNSMGFTRDGMVYFGSSARGLWEFNSRRFVNYPFYIFIDTGIVVTDPATGTSNVPIGSLGPDKCPACRLDILKKGAIKNLQIFNDRNLTVFVSDMNSLFTFNADAKGSENLKFVEASSLDTEMHPLINQVEKSNRIVKGLITEYGKIKALITTEPRMEDIPASLFFRSDMLTKADLKNYVAPPPPTLKLSPAYEHYNPVVKVDKEIPGYMAVVKQGDSITLRGSGFASPGKENNLITVWVGNQMITEKLAADSDGAFSIKLEVPRRAGPLRITVSQKTVYGMLTETIPIEILNAD